jgi:hypothetical protein
MKTYSHMRQSCLKPDEIMRMEVETWPTSMVSPERPVRAEPACLAFVKEAFISP